MQQKNNDIVRNISDLSYGLGFADFGIAKAEELVQERERYLRSMHNGYFAGMDYLSRNIEKRLDPRLLTEEAKSILVFLAPYGEPSGCGVASYALGEDYHKIIKDKLHIILQKLTDMVQEQESAGKSINGNSAGSPASGPRGRVFTDSAPVLERAWAVKAGLGFIGKNTFLISRKAGIRTFIGIIVTDIELPCVSPGVETQYCGSCRRCLDACPTGALCAPYTIDSRKCISYNTIENKELSKSLSAVIVEDNIPKLHGRYFGCDACMDVCPWNSKNISGWQEFSTRRNLLSDAAPEWWKNLSGKEFNAIFATSPLLRGGLENIRTAQILNEKEEFSANR